MLNIWYSRENINRDRFMYARIEKSLRLVSQPGHHQRVLLLVPDQYTLQAERNAFRYLNVPGLMDLEILSMSGLGRRVLAEVGGGREPFINQYGKYMLIARLLHQNKRKLQTFKNLEASADFARKLNDMIAELKNYNVGPEDLSALAQGMEQDGLLKRKLEDVALVFEGYERHIRDRYVDAADHLKLLAKRIAQSEFARTSEIWLSGFDYLSPAMTDTVLELARHSEAVNLLLTAEPGNPFFGLTNALTEILSARAEAMSVPVSLQSISPEYALRRPPEIAHIEKALFTYPQTPFPGLPSSAPSLQLVAAANYYAEAETAATRIVELVRDGGMRYRDILVLCNDMKVRAPIIDRVFSRYGLPVFMDRRRTVEHNPVPEYILSLLEISAGGRQYEDVFRLLKTGLTGLDRAVWEELENYVIQYKIRGSLWTRPFTRGLSAYSEEEMAALEETREQLAQRLTAFEGEFKAGKTARARTEALYRFLTEEAKLPQAAAEMAARLEEAGRLEYAAEMAGIWDVVAEILEQMISVLGDLPMAAAEFATVLRTGFEAIKIGLLPPSPDQIVLGTMQRTRSGDVKAVFVLGANDGVLPAFAEETAVISEEERLRLADAGCNLGRGESQIILEEQLAIYRNFAKPESLLYVSYAASDEDGREIRPSLIFQRLRRLFPDVAVERDIENAAGDPLRLIQSREESLGHLTEALRSWTLGQLLPRVWIDVFQWFGANRPADADNIIAGLTFRNRRERVNETLLRGLYGSGSGEEEARMAALADAAAPLSDAAAPLSDAAAPPSDRVPTQAADILSPTTDILTSPSALERYSRCPFSWFLDRGIRLKERRIHELDSRNVGDIYHEVLMRYGMELSKDGLPARDSRSAWQTITKEAAAALTGLLYEESAALFREGLLSEGGYERYRSERMRKITAEVAWALTEQVRAGSISDMRFETAFGGGGDFPPIEVTREGKTVRVRGKIDRLDVLEGGYARIIDYKSGSDAFSMEDVLSGWQMQLLLYLKAVSSDYKPAGVFYFKIAEPHVEDKGKGDVVEEIRKQFRLDGISVRDPAVETVIGHGAKTMDPADFDAMQETVSGLIKGLCGRLLSGDIAAHPMTAKNIKGANNRPMTACTYCNYRSVCSYDFLFE